ncbi:hypothetical protein SASPL_154974 [Salvia splendens]|uniref:Integrase catalytic domain-containing protein n=1 Tax=Salvia splendens TaxID=180675 RepID=A0A8X8Z086_SALSN|nr:hypothetical protein SASPL_154974 [Salvia splendens]
MCPIREWFFDFEELNGGLVYMGNDSPCKTTGIGSIKLRNQDGSTRILKDVRYVPQLKKNLISLGALESKGLVVMMRDGILKATSGALVMLKGVRKNNLYYYQGSTVVGTIATATSSNKKNAEATKLWHLRLGHAGERSLQILAKQGLLKEYKSDPFQDVCQKWGIVRHFTVRNTPHQNGVSEHMNRTIVEKVRCMLSNAGLDRKFWAEAITYAQHIVNRLPCSAIDGKTPLEVWSGKPATDYDSLRIFGSIAYYHVTESKLDPRAKKALFMGYSAGVKGYRLWCLESKKTIVSRDVTFDESSMLNKENPNSSDTSQQVEYTPKQVEFEEAVVIPTTNTTNDSPTEEEEESDDEEVPPQEPSQQSEPIAVRRTRRENKKPARFADMVAYALPVVDDLALDCANMKAP